MTRRRAILVGAVAALLSGCGGHGMTTPTSSTPARWASRRRVGASLRSAQLLARDLAVDGTIVDSDSVPSTFHTPDDVAHVAVHVEGQREKWPLGSRGFVMWLRRLRYEAVEEALPVEAVAEAVATFEAKAIFAGEEHEAYPASSRCR